MDWPESLIAELAERRCVIFLGAGASAGCEDPATHARPPTWKQLLEEALARVNDAGVRPVAEAFIAKEQYLDAAEVIFSRIEDADSRTFYRQKFALPNYQPSDIHKIVAEIDPKVVVTTNYDQIYEDFCDTGDAPDGYSVRKYYEGTLLNEIRSRARLVVKAHGCVTETTKMVLTRSQYFRARADNRGFFSILDSLFLVNTLLFIGYSLSDPDIALVLENSNIAAQSNHPHYALVSEGRHAAITKAMRDTYNVKLLEYPAPANDHSAGIAALGELRDAVLAFRARYSNP